MRSMSRASSLSFEPRNLSLAVGCAACAPQNISHFVSMMYQGVLQEIGAQNASDRATVQLFLFVSMDSQEQTTRVTNWLIQQNVTHVLLTQSLFTYFQPIMEAIPTLLAMVVDPVDVPSRLVGRVQNVQFRDDQIGYLAGLMAGSQTQSGTVGIITGPIMKSILNMRAGFFQGVAQVCAWCTVLSTSVEAFSSRQIDVPAIVNSTLQEGVDVVWCAGGSGGSALLLQLTSRGLFGIGVDADEFLTTFAAVQNSSQATRLLTSAQKRSDLGARLTVSMWLESYGTLFDSSTRLLGAEHGAVDLAPCHRSCDQLSNRATETVDFALQQLITGETAVGVDTALGAVAREDDKSTAVQFPPIRTLQHVDLGGQWVQVALFYERMVLFEGNWTRLILYDSLIPTVQRVMRVQQAPSNNMPTLSTGFVFRSVLLGGEYVGIVHGGRLSNGAINTQMYGMYFNCASFVGLCTAPVAWVPVVLSLNSTAAPLRFAHAAASKSNALYIAGGYDDGGLLSSEVWVATFSFSSASKTLIYSVWTKVQPLPRLYAAGLLTIALWTASDDRIYLVAAGVGAHPSSADAFVSFPSTTREVVSWREEGLSMNKTSGTASVRPPSSSTTEWNTISSETVPDPVNRVCIVTDDTERLILVGGRGNTTLVINTATRKLTSFTVQFSSDVLNRPLVCQSFGMTQPATPVNFAGQQSELEDVARSVTILLPRNATTTAQLFTFNSPHIVCNADRQLYRTASGASCLECAGHVVNDTCFAEETAKVSSGTNIAVAVVIVIVVVAVLLFLGVLVSFLLFLTGCCCASRRKKHLNAPVEGPLAIGFVSVRGSASLWREDAGAASRNLRLLRTAVLSLAQRHRCYQVRCVADSVLLTSIRLEDMLRFASSLSRQFANGPNRLVIVVHWASPTVRFESSIGYDYTGPEVQEVFAGRSLANAGEILCSFAAVQHRNLTEQAHKYQLAPLNVERRRIGSEVAFFPFVPSAAASSMPHSNKEGTEGAVAGGGAGDGVAGGNPSSSSIGVPVPALMVSYHHASGIGDRVSSPAEQLPHYAVSSPVPLPDFQSVDHDDGASSEQGRRLEHGASYSRTLGGSRAGAHGPLQLGGLGGTLTPQNRHRSITMYPHPASSGQHPSTTASCYFGRSWTDNVTGFSTLILQATLSSLPPRKRELYLDALMERYGLQDQRPPNSSSGAAGKGNDLLLSKIAACLAEELDLLEMQMVVSRFVANSLGPNV